MGIFDKLLSRQPQPAQFSAEQVRPALRDLSAALEHLAAAMDTPDSPAANPGWRGRLRDLRGARSDVQLLLRTEFTRDELFEVLLTVRPVFRGQAPKGFEQLTEPNAAVIKAIEAAFRAGS